MKGKFHQHQITTQSEHRLLEAEKGGRSEENLDKNYRSWEKIVDSDKYMTMIQNVISQARCTWVH